MYRDIPDKSKCRVVAICTENKAVAATMPLYWIDEERRGQEREKLEVKINPEERWNLVNSTIVIVSRGIVLIENKDSSKVLGSVH